VRQEPERAPPPARFRCGWASGWAGSLALAQGVPSWQAGYHHVERGGHKVSHGSHGGEIVCRRIRSVKRNAMTLHFRRPGPGDLRGHPRQRRRFMADPASPILSYCLSRAITLREPIRTLRPSGAEQELEDCLRFCGGERSQVGAADQGGDGPARCSGGEGRPDRATRVDYFSGDDQGVRGRGCSSPSTCRSTCSLKKHISPLIFGHSGIGSW
jgi:hypothetical protein